MNNIYIHITEAERRRIERLLGAGRGVRAIARTLGRGIGTVSEEIKRNSVRGAYRARKAEHKAYVRLKTETKRYGGTYRSGQTSVNTESGLQRLNGNCAIVQ